MSTITTTYDYILKHELINKYKYNEFVDGNEIIAFNDDKSIVRLILTFDPRIETILNEKMFLGEKLSNPIYDREFKKMFLTRFWTRQIQQQTLENHAGRLTSVFMKHRKFIETYFEKFDDMLSARSLSDSTNKQDSETDHRGMEQTLPQDQINMDLSDDFLEYADRNHIQKTRTKVDDTSDRESVSFSPDNLLKLQNILEPIFEDFDRRCFLQIF